MARRSPPVVNQKCESGCTWRMFRIFNFREGHSNRRLVSNRRHLNTHAAGNGNSRNSSDLLSKVDEKCPHIGVSSRKRRDYSWKSMGCMENDQVADWGNDVTKMIVDQRFVNKNVQGKDGAGCQPEQFFNALQILNSNKELFVKLLQDPNSLLVKQIHDSQSSQVREPYHARQKRMIRFNKSQNSNARRCVKSFKSFDRHDSCSSCEPRSSNRIVVLKPGTYNVKKIADTSFGCPRPHSPKCHSYDAQNIKPSYFPLGRMKRKLRHAKRVRSKEQQLRTTDEVPCKLPCISQGLEDGKKVKELEIAGRNSPTNVHASIGERLNSYLYLKKKNKIIKFKDSELCMGQEDVSFGESCSSNRNNTPVTEGMRYYNNYEMVLRTKVELQKEGENGHNSTLGQKIKEPPVAIFDADISIRKSLPGANLHAHYDIPRDDECKESPTRDLNINNTTGATEYFLKFGEIQMSPGVASSCQIIEDSSNMRKRVEQPRAEYVGNDVTNPPTFQPDGSLIHDKFEENHFTGFISSSLYPINNLTSSSEDISDYVREILQDFSLKGDELVIKSEPSELLLDPSTFDELKGLTGQLSGCSTILLDCVIETFKEVYQKCGFLPHISSKNPKVQAYVLKKVLIREITELIDLHFLPHPSPITLKELVGKDLARRGSWLNIEVDAESIAIEVGEDVLENLVLEMASEMDTRDMIDCNEPMSPWR
ncbi:uncharacterized protein LOC133294050 [Gastrolobium bilobum]|uniref:uncharacterized protein LOC133294050 n=1 Tax=Gastrolobium bilobum TaxID=150636 RepID=UPI002AAFF04D|nr:uncharacterized protein LOC133294050 [Gastrolobium bilobum]